jgi:hypothetical protein
LDEPQYPGEYQCRPIPGHPEMCHVLCRPEPFLLLEEISGPLQRMEDPVQEAMSLWEERERVRVELLTALDEADADLEARRYTGYTRATLPQLASELKRAARALPDCKQP